MKVITVYKHVDKAVAQSEQDSEAKREADDLWQRWNKMSAEGRKRFAIKFYELFSLETVNKMGAER